MHTNISEPRNSESLKRCNNAKPINAKKGVVPTTPFPILNPNLIIEKQIALRIMICEYTVFKQPTTTISFKYIHEDINKVAYTFNINHFAYDIFLKIITSTTGN